MRRRSWICLQGFLCAATLGIAAAGAQTAPPPPVAAPVVPAAVPSVPPSRPLPPTVEEREDPFQPPPTEAERRAEEERRLRDLMRPMIEQMRESIRQGLDGQVQEGVRGAVEEIRSRANQQQQQQAAVPAAPPPAGGKPSKTRTGAGPSDEKMDEEIEKAAREEARMQAALEKANELARDPDPDKRVRGRAALEMIRRGSMPKWSSNEGVFFIGCVNKRKLYRDKFGQVFESELWFNGSSGAGGTGGNSYAAAARPAGQQTASAAGPSAIANVATVDPCAD